MSTKAERDAALDMIGNLIEVTRRNWLSGDKTDCEAAIKLGVAAEIMAEVFAMAESHQNKRLLAVYSAEVSRRAGLRRSDWRNYGADAWWDCAVQDAMGTARESEAAYQRVYGKDEDQ